MYPASKINLPALGMACAVALALIVGVPLGMEHSAGDATLVQLTPHTDPNLAPATAAAVAPNTIEVVVVGQRVVRAAKRTT